MRKIIEMIPVEYVREIKHEVGNSSHLAKLIPSLRQKTTTVVDQRHYDPNTETNPRHGRLVYAWRPNAGRDNPVLEQQVNNVEAFQTRIRNDARQIEIAHVERTIEKVQSKYNGRSALELTWHLENIKKPRRETSWVTKDGDALEAETRRGHLIRAAAQIELRRLASGHVKGFHGFDRDPIHLVFKEIVKATAELLEIDQSDKQLRKTIDEEWLYHTMRRLIPGIIEEMEHELLTFEEDSEIYEMRDNKFHSRTSHDRTFLSMWKKERDPSKFATPRGWRHRKPDFVSWKVNTRCRKAWASHL